MSLFYLFYRLYSKAWLRRTGLVGLIYAFAMILPEGRISAATQAPFFGLLIFIAVYLGVTHFEKTSYVNSSRDENGQPKQEAYKELREAGYHQGVYIVPDGTQAPCAIGDKIFIPASLYFSEDSEMRLGALFHELSHVRHYDSYKSIAVDFIGALVAGGIWVAFRHQASILSLQYYLAAAVSVGFLVLPGAYDIVVNWLREYRADADVPLKYKNGMRRLFQVYVDQEFSGFSRTHPSVRSRDERLRRQLSSK
ncbi:MAG: hypothetical protein H7318_14200 [Oligoflexus sp.]|nr:hypothetical protein [Oligoflexus sp.]